MSRSAKLALISIGLNIFGLLVYAISVSEVAFQQFALATEILSLMGITTLTLSIIALARSSRQADNPTARKIAWISLVISVGVILVIGILLLNVFVYNYRA